MALQGLTSPEPTASSGGAAVAQLGFAAAQNNFAPGGHLARVIGEMRVAPDLIYPPITDVEGLRKA